jgi:co-chaperonin GroES (HSP10)
MSLYPDIAGDALPAPAPTPIPTPLGYYLIVEPQEPPTHSAGGIALPSKTKLANRLTGTCGKVLAVGALAFTMKTQEGLDLTNEKNWPKVGEWCIFKLHAGQKLRVRQDQQSMIASDSEDQKYLLLIEDTSIICRIDEKDLPSFYAWA